MSVCRSLLSRAISYESLSSRSVPSTGQPRSFVPFYVAESLCCDSDIGGQNQLEACYSKYSILKQNNPNNPCQLWPSSIPKLTGVDPAFEAVLKNITWVNCVPDT